MSPRFPGLVLGSALMTAAVVLSEGPGGCGLKGKN